MIDIAIPPSLRRTPIIRDMIRDVKQGKPQALEKLYTGLLEDIPDPAVQDWLRRNREGEADAKLKLYHHLEKCVSNLADKYLYPDPAQAQVEVAKAVDSWAEQMEIVRRAAEQLWRDNFLMDTSVTEAGHRLGRRFRFWSRSTTARINLEQVTSQSWLLMLLSLDIALYTMRSTSNYLAREGVQTRRESWWRGQATRRQVGLAVKAYQRQLRQWDRELYWVTGSRFFLRQLGDSLRLRALTRKFGPDGVDVRVEAGWVTQAADAADELRYRAIDIHRSESFRSGHPIVAVWLLIQKWTTGYGTKPSRFVRTALIVTVTFGLLFFANDYFNPGLRTNTRFCPPVNFSHTPWWEVGIHYLYITVTNLTSLGSNAALAQYCGGAVTELLLVAASLTGYFFLATLAALLVQQIREARG